MENVTQETEKATDRRESQHRREETGDASLQIHRRGAQGFPQIDLCDTALHHRQLRRENSGRIAGSLDLIHGKEHYHAFQPPSMTRFVPFTKDDASDARKMTPPTAS